MNREEALQHFKIHSVEPLLEEAKEAFETLKTDHVERLRSDVLTVLKKVAHAAADIHYIHFQLPRINIMTESYEIMVFQYNQYWFLDEMGTYEIMSLKYLFEPFMTCKQALEQAKKIYRGMINAYDINYWMIEAVTTCFVELATFVREWLWDLDEEAWLMGSGVAPNYHIRWGSYMEKGEIVFAMDERQKHTEDLLQMIKEKPKNFFYSVWKNSALDNVCLDEQEMLFINFKGSNLEALSFKGSTFFRSNFKEVTCSGCSFEKAHLSYCTFEKAHLKQCSFKAADLTGVDFRNAEFLDVSFEEANVENAIFSMEAVPFLKLSSRQLQKILIEGDGQ